MKRLNQTWKQRKHREVTINQAVATRSTAVHNNTELLRGESTSRITRSNDNNDHAGSGVSENKHAGSSLGNKTTSRQVDAKNSLSGLESNLKKARDQAPVSPYQNKSGQNRQLKRKSPSALLTTRRLDQEGFLSKKSLRKERSPSCSSASSISFDEDDVDDCFAQIDLTALENLHKDPSITRSGKKRLIRRKSTTSFEKLPVSISSPKCGTEAKDDAGTCKDLNTPAKQTKLQVKQSKSNFESPKQMKETMVLRKRSLTHLIATTKREGPLVTSTPCERKLTVTKKRELGRSHSEAITLSPVKEKTSPPHSIHDKKDKEKEHDARTIFLGHDDDSSREIVSDTSEEDEALLTKSPAKVAKREELTLSHHKAEASEEQLADNSDLACHISQWSLPSSVVRNYKDKGINLMFQWQVECLSMDSVLNGGNLVYTAPTSAGKTMVAEILLMKTVLELRKKAVVILPFVSVSREKMLSLQSMLEEAGIRVGGYMGNSHPVGGFDAIDIAVCTIEKANNLINRIIEEGRLSEIGILVIDELHMLGDSHRGYLLELLLTKVLYVCRRKTYSVQIVGMSATLPNLEMLAQWLRAKLYKTDFRPVPLSETVKIGPIIYDAKTWAKLRDLGSIACGFQNDGDHVIYLTVEAISEGHGVLLFCPAKEWCEKLALNLAKSIFYLGKESANVSEKLPESKDDPVNLGLALRKVLSGDLLSEVLEQLKVCPAGLDAVLSQTVPFGVAFHHAGLTYEERDIVESAFRRGVIKALVATSTLASGVNLPARRVIIRSPLFGGSTISSLAYTQMVGRAGRKGVDEHGESILICKESERQNAVELLNSQIAPVHSCLVKANDRKLTSSLKRAILEVIASGVAKSPDEVKDYISCTLLSVSLQSSSEMEQDSQGRNSSSLEEIMQSCIDFLLENEFIHIQEQKEEQSVVYLPSQLGRAVLCSSLSPDEGLLVLHELEQARKCFVLENELHLLYQVIPTYIGEQIGKIDWMHFLELWESLPPSMKRVGQLVGVEERFIAKSIRGQMNLRNQKQAKMLAIHQRFYATLALNDLVHEVSLSEVSKKYNCSRGILQTLQQRSATYAGMVTTFCAKLGWHNLELLVSQFQSRLHFGIQRELCDLMRLLTLNAQLARSLYNAGYQTIAELANAKPEYIEIILRNALPFQSDKQGEEETDFDVNQRRKMRRVFITGKEGVDERKASELIVKEARDIVQKELGVAVTDWNANQRNHCSQKSRRKSDESRSNKRMKYDIKGIIPDAAVVDKAKENQSNIDQHPATPSNVVSKLEIPDSAENIEIASCKDRTTMLEENGHTSDKMNSRESESLFDAGDNEVIVPASINKNLNGNHSTSSISSEHSHHSESEVLSPSSKYVKQFITTDQNLDETWFDTQFLKELENISRLENQKEKEGEKKITESSNKSPNYKHDELNQINQKTDAGNINNFPSELPPENQNPLAPANDFPEKQHETSLPGNSDNPGPSFLCDTAIFSGNDSIFKWLSDSGTLKFPVSEAAQMNERNSKLLPKHNEIQSNQDLKNETSSMDRIIKDGVVNMPPALELKHNAAETSGYLTRLKARSICAGKDQGTSSATGQCENEKILSNSIVEDKSSSGCISPSPSKSDNSSTASINSIIQTLCKTINYPSSHAFKYEEADAVATDEYSQEINTVQESCQVEPSDKMEFKITDVTTSFNQFRSFIQKWKQVAKFSMSVGCEKMQGLPKKTIGPPRKNDDADLNINHSPGFKIDNEGNYVVGMAVSWNKNEVHYVSFKLGQTDARLSPQYCIQSVRDVLESHFVERKKTIHVSIFGLVGVYRVLYQACDIVLPLSPHIHWQDPMVANWLLNTEAGGKSFYDLVALHVPESLHLFDDFIGMVNPRLKSIGLITSSNLSAKRRASMECVVLHALMDALQDKLERLSLWNTFLDLEMAALILLAKMEHSGIGFNRPVLEQQLRLIRNELQDLETKAHSLAGRHFCISSPKDVANVLFRELGLPSNPSKLGVTSKGLHGVTHHFSTAKPILKALREHHPLPGIILDWRKVHAVLGQSVLPLLRYKPKHPSPYAGVERICSINDMCTITGRMYTKYPCLQMMPREFVVEHPDDNGFDEDGAANTLIKIRFAFVPYEGSMLISSDYCQIELRILAHFSKEQKLIDAFNNGMDVFKFAAAHWTNKSPELVNTEERNQAKQVFYSIVYGVTPKGLAQNLSIPEKEARDLIDNFLHAFPGIAKFRKETIANCEKTGYVETLSGRRRYLPAIRSNNGTERSHAQRQAVNTPIQGSAADLIKSAMIKIDCCLQEKFPSTRRPLPWTKTSHDHQGIPHSRIHRGGFLVLQMHDELIYEVTESEVAVVAKVIREMMETALQLRVKLAVKLRVGPNWGDMKEYLE